MNTFQVAEARLEMATAAGERHRAALAEAQKRLEAARAELSKSSEVTLQPFTLHLFAIMYYR
jgi:exonuclease VII small subunit